MTDAMVENICVTIVILGIFALIAYGIKRGSD